MSIMTTDPTKTVKLFFCYAREDKALRDELEQHLSLLKRQKQIITWYDREITPGSEWAKEIDTHLDSADIILLLVSRNFMASDYCFGIEMKRALEKHNVGTARVIPIILRPVYWEDAPFSNLQVLPTDALAVTQWQDRDLAFVDITKYIQKIVKEIQISFKTKEELVMSNQVLPVINKLAAAPRKKPPNEEVLKNAYKQIQIGSITTPKVIRSIAEGFQAFADDPEASKIASFDAARAAQTLYKRANLYEANALYDLKRYKEALTAYEQAIRLDPNDAYAYTKKGNALYNLKQYEEALTAYEQAIRLDPNDAYAYTNKGSVLERLGRNKDAQQAFERARQLGYNG
jgi:tetratricopeptide (TPR) repeat protein